MLVSFTQTYGSHRKELMDIYFRDERLIEFKNQFDVNFYSFHDSQIEYIEYFKSRNQVKNTEILQFTNCTYGDCIKSLLKILDKVDCTHLFFSQDDTFSADNEGFDFKMFADFIRTQKENFMVCMSYSYEDMIENGHVKPLKNKIYKVYNNSILKATTLDYIEKPCIPPVKPTWNMSDDPYVASLDLVKRCYTEEYFDHPNIWQCEMYLMRRFRDEEMTRHTFERPLFKNYNLIGQTTWDAENDRKLLKKKNLL